MRVAGIGPHEIIIAGFFTRRPSGVEPFLPGYGKWELRHISGDLERHGQVVQKAQIVLIIIIITADEYLKHDFNKIDLEGITFKEINFENKIADIISLLRLSKKQEPHEADQLVEIAISLIKEE